MSEIKLKRCPCCDGKALLCDPLKEEAFIYIPQVICTNCGLEVTSHTVESVVEKWNTRKPMQDIVKKLEEEYKFYDEQKKEAYDDKDWEDFDRNMHINRGIYEAIVIVKEVGGMNET